MTRRRFCFPLTKAGNQIWEIDMPDVPKITATELKKRMDAGEDFTLVDVRNPEAWEQSDTILPEAIRIRLEQ
jgi:hypothetical protein